MTTFFIKEQIKKYLPMLRDIQRGVSSGELESKYEYFSSNVGLCGNLRDLPESILDNLFERWPRYSGNLGYPVPDKCGASVKYNRTAWGFTNQTLYNKRTEYGRLRRELAGFLADELERELTKGEV